MSPETISKTITSHTSPPQTYQVPNSDYINTAMYILQETGKLKFSHRAADGMTSLEIIKNRVTTKYEKADINAILEVAKTRGLIVNKDILFYPDFLTAQKDQPRQTILTLTSSKPL